MSWERVAQILVAIGALFALLKLLLKKDDIEAIRYGVVCFIYVYILRNWDAD